MAKNKISYGIDLGTTNSAIARMENGSMVVKKSDTLKDTMPSCVFVNQKGSVRVGDGAYSSLKQTKVKALRDFEDDVNAFIEFKRTMGTDKTYYSSHLDKVFSSEELSAEVLKVLKSFVKDENIHSAVITVPAAFSNNQIDATIKAAKLAGFEQVELLQEPVAAAIAYGLDSQKEDGFWLVFDFGGGTFDAALIKCDEGIIKVIDTEGDNYLGGKNLDLAIVDELIIPYLEENYSIEDLLAENDKKQILRNAMKFYAEEAKIQLSFSDSYNILSDLGDIPFQDNDGNELELDIELNQSDIQCVLSPIFQKAVDITKQLLRRNNLSGDQLATLILVGGPTLSPVLRKMLTEQICAPNTSIDPMTVVARGAALYASTVDVSAVVLDKTRDLSKLQLKIEHEASTVELEEFVVCKLNKHEEIAVFAEIVRLDNAWSSGKFALTTAGDVVGVSLVEGKNNNFEINTYDDKGNIIPCEPNQFSIIQGISGIASMQTLTLSYGIEILQTATNKMIFSQIQGLERNKSLPAIGVRNGLKTQKILFAGSNHQDNQIKIPLYQGEHGADGTRAAYNIHVYDVIIKGSDLPRDLPQSSEVDLTIKVDKSRQVEVSAYFPLLDFTIDIQIPKKNQTVDHKWLSQEIKKAHGDIEDLLEHQSYDKELLKLREDIEELEAEFYANPRDVDHMQQTVSKLRGTLKKIDKKNVVSEWDVLREKIDKKWGGIEQASDTANSELKSIIEHLRQKKNMIFQQQNVKLGNKLLEEIQQIDFRLNEEQYLASLILYLDMNFADLHWSDKGQARRLLDEGMRRLGRGDSDELRNIMGNLFYLLPEKERQVAGRSDLSILSD